MMTKLTDRQIKAAKPGDKKIKLADGGGLALIVHPKGSKTWVWRYRVDGKQREMTLADPMTSRIAKEAWMRDADRVRAWAAERLSIKANNVVTVADLYSNFRLWCAEEGVSDSRIPARNSFARRLRHVEPRLVPGPNSKGARFENAILKTA